MSFRMALYLGILLFAGSHFFSMLAPAVRDRLKLRLGEGLYRGLYALVSIVGIVLLAIAYWHGRAGPAALENYYEPLDWARHITMTMVLLGFILVAASHGKGYIRKWLRNPMSIGIALWATGHLLVNGEKAVVWIFGMFLAIAIVDIATSTQRGKVLNYETYIRSDIVAVVAGVALYLIMLFGFHPYVLNIPVVG